MSKIKPNKATLELAQALKRGRELPPSHPRATTESISKALGIEPTRSEGNKGIKVVFGKKPPAE
jgi:hypothetical protein